MQISDKRLFGSAYGMKQEMYYVKEKVAAQRD